MIVHRGPETDWSPAMSFAPDEMASRTRFTLFLQMLAYKAAYPSSPSPDDSRIAAVPHAAVVTL
jgi:hypothetical protein